MISAKLDELRRNCTGYDEEGWPKTASPHAIHHKECDGCERECPLLARKIKSQINSANSNKIRIHCFESSGLEGFPSNTYETDNMNAALNCIKDVLTNKNSGISRILIENQMFADSSCYKNINALSPMPI